MTRSNFESMRSICMVLVATASLLNAVATARLTDRVRKCEQEVAELRATIVDAEMNQTRMEITYPEIADVVVEGPDFEPAPCPLEWDYDYVARVVSEEARGESLQGQMLVAQTIKNRANEWGMTPEEVCKQKNQYAIPKKDREITDSVAEACHRVFINGEVVVDEPIKWFYSTVGGFVSSSHEQRDFVIEVGNHRFFK